jgi:diguanylate cyclase (GGDEF)-like protein
VAQRSYRHRTGPHDSVAGFLPLGVPAISLRKRRSPRLLILVFAASLALVAVTATALVSVVSDHVTRSAIDSTLAADRFLSQSFVETNLDAGDMVLTTSDDARVAVVQDGLRRLVASDVGVVLVKVHGLDGTVLFSSDRSLRGTRFAISDELAETLAGELSADITSDFEGEEADLARLGLASVLEEYIPIFAPDGSVEAAFEVYRDAGPILADVGRSQQSVLVLTLLASLVLAGLLFGIFRAAQSRLNRQTDQLMEATRRDALTGLLNHGSTVEILAGFVEQARVARTTGGSATIGLALVDIDNFRNLNETHGFPAGDRVLREVSARLRELVSESTVVGRYGPDEFLVVAPPECAHDVGPAIQRLRDRLVEVSLQFGSSERLPVTMSAGLCTYPTHGAAASELLSAATVALGEAKASGGDAIRQAGVPERGRRELERRSFDVLQGLVLAVDTKDRYTKRHSEDVARYALFLADRLGIAPELRNTLQIAGLLHDVGKIGIPDGILRKPGALTADEMAIVRQHVALGHLIVRDLPDLDQVRAGVRHHHERWDGRGYLDGLAGEEIPLVARILAVGDAFSAMTTDRPYRKALSVEEALRRLVDAADSQLDPALVLAFVEGIEKVADAPLPGVAPSGTRPMMVALTLRA